MDIDNTKRGNLLISYLFKESNTCVENIDAEILMKNELIALVNSWKERKYIEHWVVAPDELISDKFKQTNINKKETSFHEN